MTPENAFDQLKKFFTESRAARKALGNLREKVEIGIVIGDIVPCAVFRQGSEIRVEKRDAVKPDFVFSIQPETVVILAQYLDDPAKDEIGEIGLGIIKEMLGGNIQVQMPGSMLSALRGGYIDVISAGGAPVAKMLGQVGFSSPAKILGFFKNLKR